MNQKVLNKKVTFFVLGLVIFLIIYLGLFVYSNLKADFLYDRALSLEKPVTVSGLEQYYIKTLTLLSAASKLNKDNAEYLMVKADYLLMAIDDGLKFGLSITDSQIEYLYKGAISLNPINFEYHLKLGWFYAERKNKQAEEELKKAIALYPMNHQAPAYLVKYYLKQDNSASAFNAIVSYLHNRENQAYRLWKEIKDVLSRIPNLSMDYMVKKVKLIAYPATNEFHFRKQGFGEIRIPLKFKVFIEEPQVEVLLYINDSAYVVFPKVEIVPGVFMHELYLDSFPEGAYLNDLAIKTDSGSSMERIEIIKHF